MACLSDSLIFKLSDGACPLVERAAALEHVDSCAECRELLAAAYPESGRGNNLTPFALTQASMNLGVLPLKEDDVVDGKYRVIGLLGAGGMGYVFDAYQVALERRVAIKVARSQDPELARRFVREAKVSAQLKSDRVVRVLDAGILPTGAPFMVMERLEGESVGEWLAREGRLSPVDAVGVMLETCRALREVHARGIVHRDIKPSNLFRLKDPDGISIKLLDFGVFKTLDGSNVTGVYEATSSHVSMGLGSPRYMAPEQLRNARSLDARADQWSLGATLFELLTGQVAFKGETMADLCAEVLSGPTPKLVGFSEPLRTELERVLGRCLSKAPEGRYEKIDQLLIDLTSLPLAPKTLRKPVRRGYVWGTTAVVSMVVGAGVAALLPHTFLQARAAVQPTALPATLGVLPKTEVVPPLESLTSPLPAATFEVPQGASVPQPQLPRQTMRATFGNPPRMPKPVEAPRQPEPQDRQVSARPKAGGSELDSHGLGDRK